MNNNKIKYFFRFISPLKGSENNLFISKDVFTSPSGEEKQKEILDSIFYARRIQRSLLTTEKYIGRNLKRLMNHA